MIGALVTLISLNLTSVLIAAGQTFGTLPITGATTTTPVTVTSTAHGVAPGQRVHGISSGVGGMPEANGLFVFQPTDPNTFALYSVSAQGVVSPVAGSNAYTSGGQIAFAFPNWQILLGRRHVDNAAAAASPRIVFVPTNGREWGLEASGGANQFATPYNTARGTPEQQAQRQNPRLAVAHTTFEVHVYACASTPDPDFGDFDATCNLRDALWSVLFDASGAGVQMLKEAWPSQVAGAGSQTQRGQHWVGLIEIQQGVARPTLASFVPSPLSLQFTVEPVNPGSTDPVVFTVEAIV